VCETRCHGHDECAELRTTKGCQGPPRHYPSECLHLGGPNGCGRDNANLLALFARCRKLALASRPVNFSWCVFTCMPRLKHRFLGPVCPYMMSNRAAHMCMLYSMQRSGHSGCLVPALICAGAFIVLARSHGVLTWHSFQHTTQRSSQAKAAFRTEDKI
jgi:hypothetical protein